MKGKHKVRWIDSGNHPKSAPDPRYPNGIDFPAKHPMREHCTVKLPYPAKRIGTYLVECQTCPMTIMVTTAGRPDDPRSVSFNCKRWG